MVTTRRQSELNSNMADQHTGQTTTQVGSVVNTQPIGSPPTSNRQSDDSAQIASVLREIRALRQDFNQLSTRVDTIERTASANNASTQYVDQEISTVYARIRQVEGVIDSLKQKICAEYDPKVTVVAQGWAEGRSEDILSESKKLVQQILNEPDVPVVRAMRIPSRSANKPGIVKIEVDTEQNKVKLLRKKTKLSESDNYRNIFLRSSKTHVERLLELNIHKLLDEIPYGHQKYRLTSNGKLVPKDNNNRGQQHPMMGPPPMGPPPMGQNMGPPPPMGQPMGPPPGAWGGQGRGRGHPY